MRKLIVLIVIVVIGWFVYDANRKLDDAKVRAFYAQTVAATEQADTEAACALIADGYTGTVSLTVAGRTTRQPSDRKTSCEGIRTLFAAMAKSGKAGSLVVDNRIDAITLSADRRQARVQTRSRTTFPAGAVISDRSTDTLITDWRGRVRLLHSDSAARGFRQ